MNLSEPSDQKLVALAREGREDAFDALLRRYRPSVLTFIAQIVRDDDLAEDLTQEAFWKVLKELESHPPERDIEGWIFTIANHVAVDHLRKKQPDILSLDTSSDTAESDGIKAAAMHLANPTPSPTPDSDVRRTASDIEQAIARLKGHHRRCMQLRYLEARSYDDIAGILGVPVGTVGSYISRARQELKKMLGYLPDALA